MKLLKNSHLSIVFFLLTSLFVFQPIKLIAATAFTTSYTQTSTRNNLGDYAGFCFTVGSQNLVVTQLGRRMTTGNTGNHTLKLTTLSSTASIGDLVVGMSGAPVGQYFYGTLATPVTLTANNDYCIFSQETNGGDLWYDASSSHHMTNTGVATQLGSAYISGGTINITNSAIRTSYVPVDFKYDFEPEEDPCGGSTTTACYVDTGVSYYDWLLVASIIIFVISFVMWGYFWSVFKPKIK